jgi:outer membrane receptor for ferrienterochelin and colicin
MDYIKLQKAALFGAVSALSLSTAAIAQTKPVAETVDELVIVGRRPLAESVAAALAVQREADSLVSVLSADAIGNLPDQNVAFAIGRLPGVGVQRDQGQARYVNLRGAPVYWTTLSFDGLSVVSPQGRDSRFDNIPSAIASQIIVEKAITPNMASSAVAGNVDIRTRRAFDFNHDRQAWPWSCGTRRRPGTGQLICLFEHLWRRQARHRCPSLLLHPRNGDR